MPEYCRTYSKQKCTVMNQCPEGTYFQIKCHGCGGWHWVDFEGYKVKRIKGDWTRTAKMDNATDMVMLSGEPPMPPQHYNCRSIQRNNP